MTMKVQLCLAYVPPILMLLSVVVNRRDNDAFRREMAQLRDSFRRDRVVHERVAYINAKDA